MAESGADPTVGAAEVAPTDGSSWQGLWMHAWKMMEEVGMLLSVQAHSSTLAVTRAWSVSSYVVAAGDVPQLLPASV